VPRARFARVSSALHWRFLPRPGSPIKPKNAAPVAAASDGRTFVLADGRTVQLAVIEVHLTRFYLDASAQGGGEQRFSAGRRLSHQIGHGCPATGQAMGDDIGWMQPEHLLPRPDGRGNPQHRPHRERGRDVQGLSRPGELHRRGNAFFTGMHPLRTGMIPPQLPGSPSYLRPGTPALAKFLLDLGYNTSEFGEDHLGDHTAALPTAHGFRNTGAISTTDAMQQPSFPDINSAPTVQGVAPPCKNTPVPGLADPPAAVDPATTVCLIPPRGAMSGARHGVRHAIRRHHGFRPKDCRRQASGDPGTSCCARGISRSPNGCATRSVC
jgi:hypothetical protein